MELKSNTVDLNTIKQQAISVITKPADFFKSLPKTGGFLEPIIFIATIGIVVGIIRAIFLIKYSFGVALGAIILTPLVMPLIAFIGAALVFLVWKLMGSQQSYETAYRCLAYSTAIAPIMVLVSPIVYLGGIIGTAWGCYLYYIASVEVHAIDKKKAQMVWGIIFVVFAVMGYNGERQARILEERWGDEEAAAEHAGEAIGNFFKGLDKAVEEEAKKNN